MVVVGVYRKWNSGIASLRFFLGGGEINLSIPPYLRPWLVSEVSCISGLYFFLNAIDVGIELNC